MIDIEIVDEVFPKNNSKNKKQTPIYLEQYLTTIMLSPIQNNLMKILHVNGPMTRKQLVIQSNTPRTTLYDNLVKLQKRKVVEKFTRNNGKRGRPLVFWKIK